MKLADDYDRRAGESEILRFGLQYQCQSRYAHYRLQSYGCYKGCTRSNNRCPTASNGLNLKRISTGHVADEAITPAVIKEDLVHVVWTDLYKHKHVQDRYNQTISQNLHM